MFVINYEFVHLNHLYPIISQKASEVSPKLVLKNDSNKFIDTSPDIANEFQGNIVTKPNARQNNEDLVCHQSAGVVSAENCNPTAGYLSEEREKEINEFLSPNGIEINQTAVNRFPIIQVNKKFVENGSMGTTDTKRKESLSKRKYSREVQVHYTEQIKEEKENREKLNAGKLKIKESLDEEVLYDENSNNITPNLTKILCKEHDKSNPSLNEREILREEDESDGNEINKEISSLADICEFSIDANKDEKTWNDKVEEDENDMGLADKRSSIRKKAVLFDHKDIISAANNRTRVNSLVDQNRITFITGERSHSVPINRYFPEKDFPKEKEGQVQQAEDFLCDEQEEGEQLFDSQSKEAHITKSRKRVIPARTIGMEHLIDIIMIDDPKPSQYEETPAIPIDNWKKVYKETSV